MTNYHNGPKIDQKDGKDDGEVEQMVKTTEETYGQAEKSTSKTTDGKDKRSE